MCGIVALFGCCLCIQLKSNGKVAYHMPPYMALEVAEVAFEMPQGQGSAELWFL